MSVQRQIETAKTVSYLLNDCGGCLLGSRGLGVEHENSDWDVAVLDRNLSSEFSDSSTKSNISNYYKVLPLGNSYLIRLYKLDILVFEDKKDFNGIVKATREVKKLPRYLLLEKDLRIQIFEAALKNQGFVEKT